MSEALNESSLLNHLELKLLMRDKIIWIARRDKMQYGQIVMTKHKGNYDLIVIGAGSGGVRASRIAAGHGESRCG